MHVQSYSEWAPASIGPYSQATVWGGLLHIAGQLPLEPSSLQVTVAPLDTCHASSQSRPRLDHVLRCNKTFSCSCIA
jgi:enamine deaminase RidA (YjgF/YER057c/UK114 family)